MTGMYFVIWVVAVISTVSEIFLKMLPAEYLPIATAPELQLLCAKQIASRAPSVKPACV